MAASRQTKNYLQGVPELLILRLVADTEMYGYQIVKGIKTRSGDMLEYGEGVIYPLLHSMQKRRLLAIRRAKVNGRPRIYYRLTDKGRTVLEEKIFEWNRITAAVKSILDGNPDVSLSS